MGQRGIDTALDLTRMPALARKCGTMPIPPDIREAMEVAAGDETACRRAAAKAGTTPDVVTDAVRFYLQHLLFATGSDSYRVLGLAPGADRGTARAHMKLLLKWLHPDRNSGMESIYAERVINAWRKLSDEPEQPVSARAPVRRASRPHLRSRVPLVAMGEANPARGGSRRLTLLTTGFLFLVLCVSVSYYVAPRLYDPLFDWKP